MSYLACATEGKMEMIAWSWAVDVYPRNVYLLLSRVCRTPGTLLEDHGKRETKREKGRTIRCFSVVWLRPFICCDCRWHEWSMIEKKWNLWMQFLNIPRNSHCKSHCILWDFFQLNHEYWNKIKSRIKEATNYFSCSYHSPWTCP